MSQPPNHERRTRPADPASLEIVLEAINQLDEPYRSLCEQLYHGNEVRFINAPGSRHNHQAWRGGYIEHIAETIEIGRHIMAYKPERERPFTESDFVLVMLLHDIEKPFAYDFDEEGNTVVNPELRSKEAKKSFRRALIEKYKIPLTEEHWNALEFVEGIPDAKYTPGERLMGPLAALCHLADTFSARIDYDWPKTS